MLRPPLTLSTRLWTGLVGAVAVTGLGLAAMTDPATTFWLAVVVALVTSLTLAVCHGAARSRDLSTALLVGAGVAGWQGVAAYDGSLGSGIALLALLTWPPGLRVVVRYVRGGVVPVAAVAATPSLDRMTDPELCQAWRRSFRALEGSPADRLVVVQLRADYLDEMSRRHPDRVEAWLAAGGRAAGGPDEYFVDPA